jgi:hypothetical protein
MPIPWKALATALLPVFAATTALAQTAALNADGFKENPRCSETLRATLADEGVFPSGIKATSPRFDLEIYVRLKDGKQNVRNWALAGDNRKGQLCLLGSSTISSFTEKDWFKKWFNSAAVTK